jgi:hypothetical protein
MTMKRMLGVTAGIAAIAAATPAAAQYAYPYGYNPYATPYAATPYAARPYGYNSNVTAIATQQCTAAVQNRLYTRTGLTGIIGQLLGASASSGRVLSITEVTPRRSTIRVRGLATSGRMAYSPYGVGAYGALGAGYQPDLTFRCDVDYRGFVRDVDINRRY